MCLCMYVCVCVLLVCVCMYVCVCVYMCVFPVNTCQHSNVFIPAMGNCSMRPTLLPTKRPTAHIVIHATVYGPIDLSGFISLITLNIDTINTPVSKRCTRHTIVTYRLLLLGYTYCCY